MAYLLDSDVCIGYLWLDPVDTERVESLVPAGIAISIITYLESYQGTFKRPDPIESQQRISYFLEEAPVIPFSLVTARICARLRHDLSSQGLRVRARSLDLMIASTALEHDLTLITQNINDYRDIPGLKVA